MSIIKKPIMRLTASAMLLATAMLLPFLTGQIPEIGSMLCPMHIPVILCGFICGAPSGALVGFIAPLFRSLTLGMPPLFPGAVCMAFELAAYGGVAGILYSRLPKRKAAIYPILLISMIIGRLVWGAATFLCLSLSGGAFTLAAFIAGAFTNAIPGIVVQLVLIPVVVMLAENPNILRINRQR